MNRSAAHSKLIRACLELLGFHRIPAWSSKTTGQYDPTTGRWRKAKGVKARKGVADITGVIPPNGRALFVECKTGSGSLSPAQRDFRDEVVAAGALYVEARNLDDLQDGLAEHRDQDVFEARQSMLPPSGGHIIPHNVTHAT